MKLILVFLILLAGFASAETIGPKIYEQKDIGPISFSQFLYSISIDCTAATVNVEVLDGDFEPVRDADSYLKYIDFAQPLIASGSTDKEGKVVHKLPGNVKLMRGLFILVIQKQGFRSKEIHFDISRCYSNETLPNPPSNGGSQKPAPPPPPEKDAEKKNDTPVPEPEIPEMTQSGGNEQEGWAGLCPLPAGLLAFPLILLQLKTRSRKLIS